MFMRSQARNPGSFILTDICESASFLAWDTLRDWLNLTF